MKKISIELTDKPGQLLHLARSLASHSINITTVYGTALGGNTSRVLLNVSDADRAVEILKAEIDSK